MTGSAGADRFDGGAGNDTLDYSDSASGVEARLDGRAGRARRCGGRYRDRDRKPHRFAGDDDTLIGNSGDNRLTGGAGADSDRWRRRPLIRSISSASETAVEVYLDGAPAAAAMPRVDTGREHRSAQRAAPSTIA